MIRRLIKNNILKSITYTRPDLYTCSTVANKPGQSHYHQSSIRKQQSLPAESSSEAGTIDKLYKLIELEVRGNDQAVLKSFASYATTAANHLGIEVGNSWTPEKPHHERFTVLRSIHVNKKCRVQYEFRTYFRFMQFHRLTGSTADTFLEYIQRNLPEGVAMKVTKVAIEAIPDHITVPDEKMIEASPST